MGLGKTLQSICILAGDHYNRRKQYEVWSIWFNIASSMSYTCRLLQGWGLDYSRKGVCNGSRNTTIFGKIPENNYMFQPLIEWAIIRLKPEITEKIICNIHHLWGGGDLVFTMLWVVCGYVEVTWTPMLVMASVVMSLFVVSTWWWLTQLGAKTCSCFQGSHFLPASDHTTGMMPLKI
jgi:hypothetical protein